MITPIVVKLGGSALDGFAESWWDDLGEVCSRLPVVLVHGWSKPLQRFHSRHRDASAVIRDRYGNQSRWTTPQVISDIKAVSTSLADLVSQKLTVRQVSVTRVVGSNGLVRTGAGERLWWHKKQLVEFENLVGPISHVAQSHLPTVAPCQSVLITPLASDDRGREVNTDADRAAAAVAAAIDASHLVLVTDVEHLLIDGHPISRLDKAVAVKFRDCGATDGMRKKLRAAAEALDRGVPKVVVGNGHVSELLTGNTGTVITPS